MSWSRFTCVLTRLKGSLAISSGRARPTLMEIRKWLPVRLHKRVVQGERGPTVDYQVHYVEVLLALCLRMFKLAGNAEEVQNLEKMRARVVRLSVLTKNREHQFKQNSSVNLVPTEETSVSEYSLLAMISSERVQVGDEFRRDTHWETSIYASCIPSLSLYLSLFFFFFLSPSLSPIFYSLSPCRAVLFFLFFLQLGCLSRCESKEILSVNIINIQ
jgi:hypothetical protein